MSAARWKPRRPGVELAANTRAWVARMVTAHDDDQVTFIEFVALARRFADHLASRPEAERVEAGLQLGEHITSQLVGRRVRAAGVWTDEGAA